MDVDVGGGANGEGETDADVEVTPTLTACEAGTIECCDSVMAAAATAGAVVMSGDLDFFCF